MNQTEIKQRYAKIDTSKLLELASIHDELKKEALFILQKELEKRNEQGEASTIATYICKVELEEIPSTDSFLVSVALFLGLYTAGKWQRIFGGTLVVLTIGVIIGMLFQDKFDFRPFPYLFTGIALIYFSPKNVRNSKKNP